MANMVNDGRGRIGTRHTARRRALGNRYGWEASLLEVPPAARSKDINCWRSAKKSVDACETTLFSVNGWYSPPAVRGRLNSLASRPYFVASGQAFSDRIDNGYGKPSSPDLSWLPSPDPQALGSGLDYVRSLNSGPL